MTRATRPSSVLSLFVLTISLHATLSSAAAGPPTFDLAWTLGQWRDSADFTIPDSVLIRWKQTNYPAGTRDDLARLRSLVGDKPDHPKRREMETLARQLEVEPDSWTHTLWYEHENRFRLSTTYSAGRPITYNDVAVDNGAVWRITDRTLHLYSQSKIPEGEDPNFRIRIVALNIGILLEPGFVAGSWGLRPISASRNGNEWTCITESEDGTRRFRRRGTIFIEGAKEILRVQTSEIIASPDPATLGHTTEFTEWRANEVIGVTFPHREHSRRADGTPSHSFELLEMRPLAPGELDPLLAEPRADGEDPVRGRVGFVSILDSRSGQSRIESADSPASPPPDHPRSQNRFSWQILAAGSAVATFLLIAFRLRK